MIRNPMNWLAIYHRTTKGGADDLRFTRFILNDLTGYTGGATDDEDARSLANALFAYLKAHVDLPADTSHLRAAPGALSDKVRGGE